MIVIRHNFETNSSSMHSLSVRKTDGEYALEELKHSEATVDEKNHDAIIVLKEGKTEIDVGWCWKDEVSISPYSAELSNSAMQVLSSFRDKMTYALATIYGYRYRNWQNRVEEIKNIFAKHLPHLKLDISRLEDKMERGWYTIKTSDYLLYPFLKENNVTMEEFLTNTKYIVIVNYAEYQKMRWLNMVDESKIESVCHVAEEAPAEMKIEDGVWKLSEGDISFGRSPFRVLGTPEGKARYALAAHHSENIDEVLAIMQEIYPEMKSIELPADEYSDDGINRGYTDDWGIIDDVPLREFILNKKYVLIADGDEYCVWKDFKKTPLFNQTEYPEENSKEDWEEEDEDDE